MTPHDVQDDSFVKLSVVKWVSGCQWRARELGVVLAKALRHRQQAGGKATPTLEPHAAGGGGLLAVPLDLWSEGTAGGPAASAAAPTDGASPRV